MIETMSVLINGAARSSTYPFRYEAEHDEQYSDTKNRIDTPQRPLRLPMNENATCSGHEQHTT